MNLVRVGENYRFGIGLNATDITILKPELVEIISYETNSGYLTLRGKRLGKTEVTWWNNAFWPASRILAEVQKMSIEVIPPEDVQRDRPSFVTQSSRTEVEIANPGDQEYNFWIRALDILDSANGTTIKNSFMEARSENGQIDWTKVTGFYPEDWKEEKTKFTAMERLKSLLEKSTNENELSKQQLDELKEITTKIIDIGFGNNTDVERRHAQEGWESLCKYLETLSGVIL